MSAPEGAILLDLASLKADPTLTHAARGKEVFTRIVQGVASTLARGAAEQPDAREAACVLATQLAAPGFAGGGASSTDSPSRSTHITLAPEAKVRVCHEFSWSPPADSSVPPDGATENEKSQSSARTWRVESVFWLEREIGPVNSAQAGGVARFAWHVQVERGRPTACSAGLGTELESANADFDIRVCDQLTRLWGDAGFCVVPPSVVGDLRGEGPPPAVIGVTAWDASRSAERPSAEGLAAPASPKGDVPPAGDPFGPLFPGFRGAAPPPGVQAQASSASASQPVSPSARGWWTPTLYGSWMAAAAAYLTGTVAQFFEKVQTLGSAATMLIYPVMQGGALAEVVTVWWQGRKQAAEQKMRNEELAKVGAEADAFSKTDAAFKMQAAKLKAQAAEQAASGGQRKGPEVAIEGGGQPEVVTQRNDAEQVSLGRPSVKQASAALKKAELTTLSAVASLPARANAVWYVRDVYVQAGATAVRLLNWAGTKFGFLVSPVLGAFTGLFGAVGGVLHIVQGTIERTRATQDTETLKDFKTKVLGLSSGEDVAAEAATSSAATSHERLQALDKRLRSDKSGSPGKASFRDLLEKSTSEDLSVVSMLADVVHDKLSKNAEHLIEAAEKQRRNANIRIGFGVGSATLSVGLGAFAYVGIGGAVALAATTAVVALAVGWLGFAVVEWVRAGRDKTQVAAPAPDDEAKITAWAAVELTELENMFREHGESEKFLVGALMARYLALSTKFDGQEASLTRLDAQEASSTRLDAQEASLTNLEAQEASWTNLEAQKASLTKLEAQEQATRFRLLKIRVRVTKRMCIEAAIDEFRALREVSEAAVKNRNAEQFIDIVTRITQHIEGKRGLERRLAAAANLAIERRAA
ncbi:hypothetical protein [Pandoraea sputorum]|nr:hypothetical protein [Pandoraea sputorum]